MHEARLVEVRPSTESGIDALAASADELTAVIELTARDGTTSLQNMRTRVVLCAGKATVDADMFRAINESGLVYDGRLVVDHRFRTTQPEIFAAGPLCKVRDVGG